MIATGTTRVLRALEAEQQVTREFMREITLRNEKVWHEVLEGFDRMRVDSEARTQDVLARTQEVLARIEDLKHSSDSQQDALLRILDEMRRDDAT